VEALTRANLLEVLRHGRVVTYITTAKGRSFIETFDELAKSQTVRPRSIYFSARN
jgi:predicted transcriptional regulator